MDCQANSPDMVRAPLVETCPNRSEWSCELDQYHPNSRGLVPSHHEIFPTAIPVLRRDSWSYLDHDGCRVAHLRVGPRPSNFYNPSLSLADECGRIPPARVESRRSLKKSCGAANPGRSRLSRRLDPLKAGLEDLKRRRKWGVKPASTGMATDVLLPG